MNFYKHHIGDYAGATEHLTWDEDMAYTRLLRVYYRDEKPIPKDIKEACRKVRATTPQQRKAVEAVLNEFFQLDEDGWHQKRCDEEIADTTAKAERNREIGKTGGRPRKTETQTVIKKVPTEKPNGYLLETQKEPNHNPSQTPDSRLQTKPTSSAAVLTTVGENETAAPISETKKSENFQGPTRAGSIAMHLRSLGIDTSSTRAEVFDWANEPKVTNDMLSEAAAMAKAKKPNERIQSAYLVWAVNELLNPKPKKTNGEPAWWTSEKGIEAKAKETGCWPARSGESYQQLSNRIREKLASVTQ